MSQYVSRLGSGRVAPRIRFPGGFAGGPRKPRRIAMLSVHTSPCTSRAPATRAA